MNWLELGQKVEGLRDYLIEQGDNETAHPSTLKEIIALTDKILDLMDNPID